MDDAPDEFDAMTHEQRLAFCRTERNDFTLIFGSDRVTAKWHLRTMTHPMELTLMLGQVQTIREAEKVLVLGCCRTIKRGF